MNDPSSEPERQPAAVADRLAREIKRLRLAAGLSQRTLASKIGYSRQYVSMIEWEDANLPSQELVSAIDTALGANGTLIALRAQAKTDQQTRRRPRTDEPGRELTASMFSPFDLEPVPADYLADAHSMRNVGWSDIDKVKEATRLAATSENRHGGGSASNTADRQLRRFAPLLRGKAAPATRRALFEAVGNLSGVAAFSAFDIADFTEAERRFRFALWCADAAGSWELRATTLADMARKAAYIGNADEHFADRTPGADAPWMCYYDEAEHMGSPGKALIPVALTRNRIEVAALRINQAVRLQRQNYPRSRTFSLTRLATLTMRLGDPREAATIGLQAANNAKQFRSQRIRDERQTLTYVSAKHRDIREVAELRSVLMDRAEPS
ncbi:helix-turn-helix transcriptional regulator [Nocardia terpenica]|uniref:helix-turn-helix transcriptional regulator n=1 Tax=Nocardia terpenica TaxID=455432 RepID=UPI001895B533|nr:helix-turn-helix transcriptional regulator [Nocardia terpenica]MBF6066189.1 helix-turn-helix transcriptional regulator [Nocardia terpenica]MBF6109289.1 helix-turn-helix transcriptional regulator [Nocardia terpenica]MBF6116405.1 helix-turn-helix transcriptional regulator [Nocardia terpenica]MBF6123590.1 helix-turn-helix transcriptional regulator [Nocardia terpenica]MBF6156838.1 helix-turn-helix transcriptional regulator [Nocardia terpenica]